MRFSLLSLLENRPSRSMLLSTTQARFTIYPCLLKVRAYMPLCLLLSLQSTLSQVVGQCVNFDFCNFSNFRQFLATFTPFSVIFRPACVCFRHSVIFFFFLYQMITRWYTCWFNAFLYLPNLFLLSQIDLLLVGKFRVPKIYFF